MVIEEKPRLLKRSRGVSADPLPYLLALLVLVLDQVSKFVVIQTLGPGQPRSSVSVLFDFVQFKYVVNSGSAFGFFPSATLIFTVAALMVVFGIVAYCAYHPTDQIWLKISLGLQLGGGLGNLVDRVHYGYVVDFIATRISGVFNVADSAITIGVIVLVFFLFFAGEGKRGQATDAAGRQI